jgi:G6PDH family F420-dependent oxidoreductase
MAARLPIGYAVSLEQFEPGVAVELAARAEQAGFVGSMAGDQFQPQVPQGGQAGFLWSVLGALGSRTVGPLGGVTTPGYRMHPAVVAQASATLECLYPGRHWLAAGSGEALSEHVVGGYWPEPPERIARMFEAVEIIKKLFGSHDSDVRYSGRYHQLESSRLWTIPAMPPPLLVATSGPATARRAGKVADGLLTVESSAERLDLLLRRFDQGVRESGRDPQRSTRVLQVRVSWAETNEQALANAMEQWPVGGLRFPTADLRSPFVIAQAARSIRPEDLRGRVLVSADLDVHRAHLQRYADLGFTHLYVHHVGRNQEDFMAAYGAQVLGRVIR